MLIIMSAWLAKYRENTLVAGHLEKEIPVHNAEKPCLSSY